METQYENFLLRKGDLLSHEGGSIVLPSFADPTGVIGQMSMKFYRILGDNLVSQNRFNQVLWNDMGSQKIDELSAVYIQKGNLHNELPWDIILSGCSGCRSDISVAERAKIAAAYALDVAEKNATHQVCFPILLTGDEGGRIRDVAPAMATSFNEYMERGKSLEIVLYAYGTSAYQDAKTALLQSN